MFHKYLDKMKKKKNKTDQVLKSAREIRKKHPSMCCRYMYFEILPESMGRDAFEKICKENGLMIKRSINYARTTDSSGVVRFDNLIDSVKLSWINQLWQSDITYFELGGRFYYITFIIDSYSRRIIGHHVSKRLTTEDTTIPCLKKAIKTRKNSILEGLVFHSDGGGQYYDKEFLSLTKSCGIINSMCKEAWENGKAERINGVIKNCYLKFRKITTYSDLIKEVDRSVRLYNSEKPHIELKRKTPFEFEKELLPLHQQAKPMMTESFDAKIQIFGASSPKKSEQAKPQNQDVFYAKKLDERK